MNFYDGVVSGKIKLKDQKNNNIHTWQKKFKSIDKFGMKHWFHTWQDKYKFDNKLKNSSSI